MIPSSTENNRLAYCEICQTFHFLTDTDADYLAEEIKREAKRALKRRGLKYRENIMQIAMNNRLADWKCDECRAEVTNWRNY